MNSPNFWRSLLFILPMSSLSCSTPERSSSREVKKETKDKRKSPIVLTAKEGDYYLNLRQNNFFDYFGKDPASNKADLYAGTYKIEGDSLLLGFYNNYAPQDLTNMGFIDRKNNLLTLFSKEPSKNRKMQILFGAN
jgi:hypothetical protein